MCGVYEDCFLATISRMRRERLLCSTGHCMWTLRTLDTRGDTVSSAPSMDTAHSKDKEEEIVKVGESLHLDSFV